MRDSILTARWKVAIFVLVASTIMTGPLLGCPQETVTCGPFTTRDLRGRIFPMHGEELLPGTKVTFILREKGRDDAGARQIPVEVDGRFLVGLPEGQYEFTITVEGFLFTLVGDVTISRDADPEASIDLRAPWC